MIRSTSLARAIALVCVAAAPNVGAQDALRNPRRVDGDTLATQAANQAIDAGLSSLRRTGVPFLGALQGGITYDHATGLVRYDVLTIGELLGGEGPHHLLGQLGGHNHGDRDTLNAGLLWRWLDTDAAWMVGGNLFFDRDFDTGAERASVGVEAATPHWRLFANYYARLSDAWHAALRDGDNFEERVARGVDLGASWSPVRAPSLDLQLKAARWHGDNVELFDDGRTLADPTVWTTRLGWTPVPLLAFAIAHDRAGNGVQDTRLELQLRHRFGQALRDELEPTTVAHREALATRLLTPVERERRIVVERRESYQPLQIAGAAALRITLRNDEVLSHAIAVSGGAGAITLALEGADAKYFEIDKQHLEVAPAPATMQSEPVAHASGLPADRDYAVTIVARDARGNSARQQVAIALQAGGAPTMTTPTIEGVVAVGETLTGAPRGYADSDNDAPGAHRMQWYRTTDATGESRIAIEGATNAQYTITPTDAGYRLVFEVTPVSLSGAPTEGAPVRSITTRIEIGAPTMTAPIIEGLAAIGNTLTARLQGFQDPDDDAEDAHRMQWYRATDATGDTRAAIEGATNAQYMVTSDDADHYLVFEVTPVSASGSSREGTPVRAVTTRIEFGAPSMSSPTIAGTVAIGSKLTASLHDFVDRDNDGEGTHAMQWYRATDAAGANRTAIPGANNLEYTVDVADRYQFLVFEVTPESATGTPTTGTPQHAVTIQVPGRAPTMTAPTIAGTLGEGQTLTGAIGAYDDADFDDAATHAYQWYRADDAQGNSRTPIDGATGLQHTITQADLGYFLAFEVTPRSATGTPNAGTPVRAVTASRVVTTYTNDQNVEIDTYLRDTQTSIQINGRAGNTVGRTIRLKLDIDHPSVHSLYITLNTPGGLSQPLPWYPDDGVFVLSLPRVPLTGTWTVRITRRGDYYVPARLKGWSVTF